MHQEDKGNDDMTETCQQRYKKRRWCSKARPAVVRGGKVEEEGKVKIIMRKWEEEDKGSGWKIEEKWFEEITF